MTLKHFHSFEYPMAACAVCITAIILLFSAGLLPPLIPAAIASALFCAAAAVHIRKGGLTAAILPLALIALASVSLCNFEYKCSQTERAMRKSDTAVLLITDEPLSESKNKLQVKARVISSDILACGTGVELTLPESEVSMGDKLSADIRVTRFAAQLSLNSRANGILAEVKCSGEPYVIGRNAFISAAGAARKYVRELFCSSLPENESSVLCALIIGDRSAVTDELQEAVRGAGLSHVLVVSGMHLATLMSGLTVLLRLLCTGEKLQVAVKLICVAFFSAVCGFTMSVLRAGVTFVLAAFAVPLRRSTSPVNILAGAVSLILAVSPFAVFSISFELSVLSTLGILVVMPILSDAVLSYIPDNGIVRSLVNCFTGSIAAMLMTMPVVIWNFGEFSAVAPITNVLVSYPVSWALLTAALGLLLSPVPFIYELFLRISGLLVKWFSSVALYLGSDSVMLPIGKAGCMVFTAILILTLLWIYKTEERRRNLKLKRVMTENEHN